MYICKLILKKEKVQIKTEITKLDACAKFLNGNNRIRY